MRRQDLYDAFVNDDGKISTQIIANRLSKEVNKTLSIKLNDKKSNDYHIELRSKDRKTHHTYVLVGPDSAPEREEERPM